MKYIVDGICRKHAGMLIRTGILLGIAGCPIKGLAHHAVAGNYDTSTLIELEGEVTDILWRNPHVQASMRVVDENGNENVWEMATTALSNMRRWQIDPSFMVVGDTIRVAGHPAHRVTNGLYFTNLLTDDGQEVLLGANVERRWTDRTIEMSASRRRSVGFTTAPELGLFRIWSTPDNIPMLLPRGLGRTAAGRSNLTDAALNAVDAFEWTRDNPLRNCAPKGMPMIMEAPYPFEFVQDGENILWHNEEFDTVRTIHMAPDASATGQPDSLLGYSIGRWVDERTLAVTTTHMNWGHFDGQGIPMSTAATLEERFTVSEQGDRLDYSMTLTDPEYLIEPLTFGKHWVWYPDAVVGDYDCTPEAED